MDRETREGLQRALILKIRELPPKKLRAVRWYICQILQLERQR